MVVKVVTASGSSSTTLPRISTGVSRGISRWLRDDQPGQVGARQVFEHRARAGCGEDHGRIAALDQRADRHGDGADDALGRIFAQGLGGAGLGLAGRGEPVDPAASQA